MSFELPELDRKLTQAAVEAALEKYRLYKTITSDEREAQTTAAWSDSPKGDTGTTSDQTSNIAIHNVDSQEYRRRYCERIEKAVKRLPMKERILITERYLNIDCDFDYVVYNHVLDPPIGETTYYKRKWKAFYKIALTLNIQVVKEERGVESNRGN
ncbi:ArpU family phage packaging/lysis transcriptional regulator [Paenibacillus wynnii]|uniref:Transcriptional regulator n=1 Tax=Paenibacillus wynnii TaxID=268407 RepID=A0A098MDL0_9BACL|nr:ArpU family phage packaging/lysis transcriptional regulator [Paenibacillus wynnii]KGE18444.1 transcriptional regulator [Paenibacillus wynnii]KGE20654.1 transcriptional regulator [Paenibacillus wynnii]